MRFVDELPATLAAAAPTRLLLSKGFNTDAKAWSVPAQFDGMGAFKVDDSSLLWGALAECRVIKSPAEQALLRFISLVTSEAHMAVMQVGRGGKGGRGEECKCGATHARGPMLAGAGGGGGGWRRLWLDLCGPVRRVLRLLFGIAGLSAEHLTAFGQYLFDV